MESKNSRFKSLIANYPFLSMLLSKPAGMLLVFWGWAQFANYLRYFLVRYVMLSYTVGKSLEYFTNGLVVLAVLYSIAYLWYNKDLFRKSLVVSLLLVWGAWIVSLILANLIQMNVMQKIVFELQHSLFMLLTSIALFFTGILLNNKSIKWGSLIFALLTFAASFLMLKYQMALEAIGWMVAVAIPGHRLMAASSNKS